MEKEITLTPVATIVAMTKALPEIPDGAKPMVYDQVIDCNCGGSGQPDPAHND